MTKIGQLNDRITIHRPTGAQGAWGAPEPVGWEEHAKVWCDFRFRSGSEFIRADADVSIVRASARIRWRTDIDAGMRVLYQGQVFDIEAVLPSSDRKHIDLVCKLLPVVDAPAPVPEPDPGDGGWG